MAKKQSKKPQATFFKDMPKNEKERLELMIRLNQEALTDTAETEIDDILRTQIEGIKERIKALKY
jgi:hypothetical protein